MKDTLQYLKFFEAFNANVFHNTLTYIRGSFTNVGSGGFQGGRGLEMKPVYFELNMKYFFSSPREQKLTSWQNLIIFQTNANFTKIVDLSSNFFYIKKSLD